MAKQGLSPMDPSSFSRPDLAVVTNIFISLNVNFAKRIFSGNTDLTVQKIDPNATEIILDAKDLNISEIVETDLNTPLKYNVSQPVGEFGSKLVVELPPKDNVTYIISIRYETTPSASGLQWLDKEQTAGKEHPFVFSQFQAVHARSVIPCQDTPAVKTKYSAVISAPNELQVLMSAKRVRSKPLHGGTLHHFVQDIPVPSYLIAIAIGALESRELGPRSHVWAEKELIEEAAYEFANTEHQLKTAEELCGPYEWGIYDLLVLPPSFPFGGMENPCLTFVTPTLLAGDRSLANVVAHEIAHSWTGNLVTNRNFEHFWLNEGFTVFVERKILGRLESAEVQDFDAYCGTVELQETIKTLGEYNPLTCLVVDLKKGIHPDDSFSRVPYEKGHTFLRHLEDVVGGPSNFEPFMRKYFETYKYKSVDTGDFRSFFETYFTDNTSTKSIDWGTWLQSPGMPPVIPKYDTTLLETCKAFTKRWLEWDDSNNTVSFTKSDFDSLSSPQLIQVLQEILEETSQPVTKLKAVLQLYNFDHVKNSEVKFRWLRICLKAHWEEKIDAVLGWVNEIGRMKFVRPLYRDLYDWETARPRAIQNFNAHRKYMMHVTAYTVAKELHVNE